jgi:hypothetical protein
MEGIVKRRRENGRIKFLRRSGMALGTLAYSVQSWAEDPLEARNAQT